ncbi:hypothetical protein ACFZBC_09570 [Streptomyces luteogriseus]|uniref:hypothetical protein n=1 Tax=Streptomyces luteogriseus TaxID=68233 RepID=UPI0036E1FB8B
MLEVELDIFSGMPNPKWILSRREEGELTERIQAAPEQVSPVSTSEEPFNLGYRGFIIRVLKEDDGPWSQHQNSVESPLPGEFRVGRAPGLREWSVAQWLLETSARRAGVDEELISVASRGVSLPPPLNEESYPHPSESTIEEQEESETRGTWFEGEQCSAANSLYVDNGALFNQPQNVGNNNCYCFASNYMAGQRYALPGRYRGRPARDITVGEIDAGLRADGWRDSCQSPGGLTIGAAIWPGRDYHFWRLVSNGNEWLWGHKPGGTPVIYKDRSNWTLKKYVTGAGSYIWMHPESCNRGEYTVFLGFYYQKNSTAFCS